MDPITLIVTALATGATFVVKETASAGIKDAYQALKGLIQLKFRSKPDAQNLLAKHEEKPDIWGGPLKDALGEATADQDEEIVKAAQQLMMLMNSLPAATSKYNVQISGKVQGLVQGDKAQVTMTFGHERAEK